MALIKCINEQFFELSNQRISYIFQVSPEGLLEHLYFGSYINTLNDRSLPAMPRRVFRSCTLAFEQVPNYNLSDIAQEYPCFGSSDMREPAFHARNADGNTINILRYVSHSINTSKPSIKQLPSAREDDSETLSVVLLDSISNIEVALNYTIYANYDVIAKSVEVRNCGNTAIYLDRVFSGNLDLPSDDYELLYLTGSWSREFNEQRMAVPVGQFNIAATSATSGNFNNPFMAVLEKGATETHGRIYANALMYSGNFTIQTQLSEFDTLRLGVGINPFNFSWQLEAGQSFCTPELLQVYSGSGLSGMSAIWHDFIRDCILPLAFKNSARPIYLNTWEALYFDVNEAKLIKLATKAKALGLEMLVLDDGWFKGRHDDRRSLGDWCADSTKFPNGIDKVASAINQMGLQFGLWFEPEMVSQDSDLYRQHPDWVIQVPNRKASTGRSQLTLDLSQQIVVDYLFERLDAFLSSGNINYVKWDMNRAMTDQGSMALPIDRQQEIAHRYMLGLYQLVERIATKYPDVLFENCASGGNRFDLGMLNYMAQGWISDMSEPIGRLNIINGASYLFPLDVIASYIGPVPSHQNGRLSSLKLRQEVGFFAAARGLSLNDGDIDNQQLPIQNIVQSYKQSALELIGGSFSRLRKTTNEFIWQYMTADKKTIYLGYFYLLSEPNQPLKRIRLRHLEEQSNYALQRDYDVWQQSIFSGSALMQLGVDLPFICAMQPDLSTDYMPAGDFSSRIMKLTKQ